MGEPASQTHRIVIVGGGVGGLALASQLAKRLGKTGKAAVTLVDRGPLHVWKPMLHEFAAGTADPHDKGLAFPVQARRCGFTFAPGDLVAFHPSARKISVRLPGTSESNRLIREVPYDRLILAMGSHANDFGTSGAKEHCHFIDDLHNALQFNEALRAEIANHAFSGGRITVAIVGGGATGVELAAEIRKLIEVGASFGIPDLKVRLDVTLIEANSRILKSMDKAAANLAADRLKTLGVRILCNERVSAVDETGCILSEGRRVDAGLMVWTAGVAAGALLRKTAALPLSRSGQVVTDDHLRVKGFEEVYAIGDCSSFHPSNEARPLPPTAQVASQQADYLAKLIAIEITGKSTDARLGPFQYQDRGSLVSLGAYGSFGVLPKKGFVPSLVVRGAWASILHPLFFRIHMFRMLGPLLGTISWLRDGLTRILRPGIKF